MRATLNLETVLQNVHCHDEGDGWGNAEPYIWTVFFKGSQPASEPAPAAPRPVPAPRETQPVRG